MTWAPDHPADVHRSPRFLVYRAHDPAGHPVVVKTIRPDRPDQRSAELLEHEHDVLRALDLPGVARPVALEKADGASALVLEDAGPTDLAEWLSGHPAPIEKFWAVAIPLTETLAGIHARGVLHRDIKPSNVVVGADDRTVTLVDFTLAAQAAAFAGRDPPELGTGTLPYLSPEETGRLARLVDERSDLYGLGATLYEVLTGAPPFSATDPLELTHRVLARPAVAPSIVNPAVPEGLSDIVLRLLAKAPDDRYQTATALLADLAEARRRWSETGTVEPFRLGDLEEERALRFPDRLFGREAELEAARATITRAWHGGNEIVVIRGCAGTGKTALVDFIRRECCRRAGYVVAAKFDMGKAEQPYGTILEGVRSALRLLSAKGEPSRDVVRHRLRQAIEPVRELASEYLPELPALFGLPPATTSAAGADREAGVRLLLASVLSALGSPERPCSIVFDDLQWATLPCLNVLRALVSDTEANHRLLVVTTRSREEDGPADLAAQVVDQARQRGANLTEIRLDDLGRSATAELVGAALMAPLPEAEPLATLVFDKTHGNPLLVRQLLQSLHRQGTIWFDRERRAWSWDLARAEAATRTEDLDQVIAGLGEMPTLTLDLLKAGACLDHRILLRFVVAPGASTPEQVAEGLAPAVRAGILVPEPDAPAEDGPTYRFVHDRVHQLIMRLTSDEERRRLHGLIGRHLLATLRGQDWEQHLFAVVNRLNLAGDASGVDPVALMQLNAQAGMKAKAAGSEASALEYLRRGIEILPEGAWCRAYDLAMQLHREGAVCAYVTGHEALGDQLIDAALAHARDRIAAAGIYGLKVRARAARGAAESAVEVARTGLRLFGYTMPSPDDASAVTSEEAELERALAQRTPDDLLSAPVMSDPDAIAVMGLLAHVIPAAYYIGAPMIRWTIARVLNLSLRLGNAPETALAFPIYGMLRSLKNDDAAGEIFGRVGIRLAERLGQPQYLCRALAMFGTFLNHWTSPIRTSPPLFRRAIAVGLEAGDLEYVAYAQTQLVSLLFSSHQELIPVLAETERALSFSRKVGSSLTVAVLTSYRRAIRLLRSGLTAPDADRLDKEVEEALAAASWSSTAVAVHHALNLQVSFLLDHLEAAMESSRIAGENLALAARTVLGPEHNFYTSMTLARWCEGCDEANREELVGRIVENQRALGAWASRSPASFRAKHLLVEGELARLRGRQLEALACFEDATEAAARESLLQDEALGNELAGRVYAELGLRHSARRALRAAVRGYARWGATARASKLEAEFADVHPGAWSTLPVPMDETGGLDVLSLAKSAAAMAREVDPDRLLEDLTQVCMEAAGAERGVLILEEPAGSFVRAEGALDGGILLLHTPLADASSVPRSIIERVRSTRTPLVRADALADPDFRDDPYVATRRVRAVLAVPLLRQDALVGAFYFENNLIPGAFAPARVKVMELLAAQAATSLELTRLVHRLRGEVDERRRAQDVVRFLAEVSAELGASLDYEATLTIITRRTLPFLADLCFMDLVEADGRIRRVAVAHADQEIERAVQCSHLSQTVATRVIDAGKSLLIEEITDQTLRELIPDEDCRRRVAGLGLRTALVLPLKTGTRIMGVLHLASATPGRYLPADVTAAQELARRAAAAIENARLYEQARRAIRMRDEFLSIASHELYTPVTSLQLALHSIIKGPANIPREAQLRILTLAERQTRRLTQLIDELLDVSRIQTGHFSLKIDSVDLTTVAREVMEKLAEPIARSHSTVTLHADRPVVGHWDRMRLDQVVTNLLSNALKFGAGKPIDVKVERMDHVARLEVRDRGIGIPPDRLPHIFERFVRAVPDRQFGGLGLGLYIVREIVAALDGTVRVDSPPHEGTTFVIELPFGTTGK